MTGRARTTRLAVIAMVLVGLLALVGCAEKPPTESAYKNQRPPVPIRAGSGEAPPEEAPADAMEALMEEKCASCHDTMRIYVSSYAEPSQGTWEETIKRMEEAHGAVLTDDEVAQMVGYLVERPLEDAERLIGEKCTTCHDAQRIYDAVEKKADWGAVITSMKEAHGLVLTDEEQATIMEYLQ